MMYSKRRKNIGGRRKRSICKSNGLRMRGGAAVDFALMIPNITDIEHLQNVAEELKRSSEWLSKLYSARKPQAGDDKLLATLQQTIANNIALINKRIDELSS